MTTSRFFAEFRAETDGNTLRGTAAVFGPVAEMSRHYERLDARAFDKALAGEDDIVALFNHDRSMPLGRRSAGSLRLHSDNVGLHFEVDLPDTTLGRDMREMVRSGLITGASFGFIPGDDRWERAPDGRQVRTHTSVARLLDVSPVTEPAYTDTSVQLRHIDFESLGRRPDLSLRTQLITARHRALIARGGH